MCNVQHFTVSKAFSRSKERIAHLLFKLYVVVVVIVISCLNPLKLLAHILNFLVPLKFISLFEILFLNWKIQIFEVTMRLWIQLLTYTWHHAWSLHYTVQTTSINKYWNYEPSFPFKYVPTGTYLTIHTYIHPQT